jgi:hypothetical protein
MIGARNKALNDSVGRGNPSDDVKLAANDIYRFIKRNLNLTACGDDQMSFARNKLAPLIKPSMTVYQELREDIFG